MLFFYLPSDPTSPHLGSFPLSLPFLPLSTPTTPHLFLSFLSSTPYALQCPDLPQHSSTRPLYSAVWMIRAAICGTIHQAPTYSLPCLYASLSCVLKVLDSTTGAVLDHHDTRLTSYFRSMATGRFSLVWSSSDAVGGGSCGFVSKWSVMLDVWGQVSPPFAQLWRWLWWGGLGIFVGRGRR